jgi:hypothetical protein
MGNSVNPQDIPYSLDRLNKCFERLEAQAPTDYGRILYEYIRSGIKLVTTVQEIGVGVSS